VFDGLKVGFFYLGVGWVMLPSLELITDYLVSLRVSCSPACVCVRVYVELESWR
jgi:hypothetical protein